MKIHCSTVTSEVKWSWSRTLGQRITEEESDTDDGSLPNCMPYEASRVTRVCLDVSLSRQSCLTTATLCTFAQRPRTDVAYTITCMYLSIQMCLSIKTPLNMCLLCLNSVLRDIFPEIVCCRSQGFSSSRSKSTNRQSKSPRLARQALERLCSPISPNRSPKSEHRYIFHRCSRHRRDVRS